MHSESALVHMQAVALFSQPGMEDNLRFEERHKEIIDHFGRYPHRNAILGCTSTAEELAFLSEPGSSFSPSDWFSFSEGPHVLANMLILISNEVVHYLLQRKGSP